MTKTSTQPKSILDQLNPTPGYLLIQPEEQQKQTLSGIYLPETVSAEKPQVGTVLASGTDDISDAGAKKSSPAKKGDRVIFKEWGGNEVKLDGKKYLFVKFGDILAVIA